MVSRLATLPSRLSHIKSHSEPLLGLYFQLLLSVEIGDYQDNLMKLKALFACIVLSLLTSDLFAGKLYKIVDENGNVTFSQYPPATQEKAKGLTIEEKKVRNESETTLVVKGETEFCGKIQLPRQRERKEYFFSEIANRMKYWEQDLERKEGQLRKNQENYLKQSQYRSKYRSSAYQSNHHLERNKKLQESMKDLRCAISWGNKHQEGAVKAKAEMSNELARLQSALDKLTEQRYRACGEEPIYDPTLKDNKRQRSNWSKCSRRFRSDISKLERLIRKESQKLEKF